MRSPTLLGLALAAATVAGQAQATGQFTTPAGAAFASACAGLGFSGGGNAGDDVATLTNAPANCAQQTSAIGGSAAASVSNHGSSGGVAFANAASSSAGPKAIHLDATNASAPQANFPAGMANGGFSDQFNMSAAGQTGDAVWVIPIKVLGSMSANGLGASGLLSVAAFEDRQSITAATGGGAAGLSAWSTFNALNDPLFRGSPSGSSWDFENVEWRVVDFGDRSDTLRTLTVNDTIYLAVPFTFGVSFDLSVFANVRAGENSSGGDPDPNTTSLDFQDTIAWGGPGYVLTNAGAGPAITGFDIGSLTGTDYSTPFQEGVPEPATWALMLAGFFGLGAGLRRRGIRPRSAC